jgi:uncharacterized protein (TIGR02757 family)
VTALADLLGTFVDRFDADAHIPKDPLQFPHRYSDRADVEAVAFLSASLAFGRVASFSAVLESMLSALGPSPAQALVDLDEDTLRRATPKRYRWLAEEDLRALLRAVGSTLAAHGSLEAAYVVTGEPWADLGRFLDGLRCEAERHHPAPTERARALAFLFPRTRGAAACKRQHLFLRWMVRRSHPDLGLWSRLEPSALVMPCDVHTARIGHALGLNSRPEPSRKTADELTRALREIDPSDPVRFDFALCHLGISGGCKARRIEAVCSDCDLKSACRWW